MSKALVDKLTSHHPFALECRYNIITRRIVTTGSKLEMDRLAKSLSADIEPAVIPNPHYVQQT